jgi:hypothetical protein
LISSLIRTNPILDPALGAGAGPVAAGRAQATSEPMTNATAKARAAGSAEVPI